MVEDKEYSDLKKYIADLKSIRSDIHKILDEDDEKQISRAAKHYPKKTNRLLIQRNIKSASSVFPFFDLALLNLRKKRIDLIDLNLSRENKDLLWDVIRIIERELEEL